MTTKHESGKCKQLYHMEEISGDNYRPGMEHCEGWLVRFRFHTDFGWLSCKTFASKTEAEEFIESI